MSRKQQQQQVQQQSAGSRKRSSGSAAAAVEGEGGLDIWGDGPAEAQQQRQQQPAKRAKRSGASSAVVAAAAAAGAAAAALRRPAVPAVEIDPAGCSYNPDHEQHQEAVALAVAAETRKLLDKVGRGPERCASHAPACTPAWAWASTLAVPCAEIQHRRAQRAPAQVVLVDPCRPPCARPPRPCRSSSRWRPPRLSTTSRRLTSWHCCRRWRGRRRRRGRRGGRRRRRTRMWRAWRRRGASRWAGRGARATAAVCWRGTQLLRVRTAPSHPGRPSCRRPYSQPPSPSPLSAALQEAARKTRKDRNRELRRRGVEEALAEQVRRCSWLPRPAAALSGPVPPASWPAALLQASLPAMNARHPLCRACSLLIRAQAPAIDQCTALHVCRAAAQAESKQALSLRADCVPGWSAPLLCSASSRRSGTSCPT